MPPGNDAGDGSGVVRPKCEHDLRIVSVVVVELMSRHLRGTSLA